MPDETFLAVTRRAAELGISRSRFLVLAAEQMLAEDADSDLTARIDEAIAAVGRDQDSVDFTRAAAARALDQSAW